MSTRVKHPRKATASTSYADPAVFDEIGGWSDEEDEEEQEDNKGTGKGKGRARKNRSDDDDEDDSPKPKKRKTAKGKGKAKKDSKPKEDLLRTMPMDLLVEIFSYLVPGELLNLSRTAKAYHDLLSSKKSRPIWRRSRRIVKLPDLEDESWSEAAYAALMFGNKCECCKKTYTGRPDFYLRLRLCKECRKDSFVRLHKLEKEHPEYHPRLAEVVARTPPYTLQTELDYWDKLLSEAQEQDDANAEIARLQSSRTSASTTRSGRKSRASASHNGIEPSSTPSVDGLVADRKEELEMLATVGKELSEAWIQTKHLVSADSSRFWSEHWRIKRALRPDAIKEKEKEEKEQDELKWQRERATHGKAWDESPLIKSSEPLTDDEWLRIKNEVLDIVAANRQEHEMSEATYEKDRQWDEIVYQRKAALVDRHKQLRTLEHDDVAKAAFPLKADFLLFESIRALQLPKEPEDYFEDKDYKLTPSIWNAALPLIKEELAEYRLNVLLSAIKLILGATSESPVPDDDEILSNLEQYDDEFFGRATSLLCCAEYGCTLRRTRWFTARDRQQPSTFIGSFQAVLQHQHDKHSDIDYWYEHERAKGPRHHLALPLEVTCATTALLELGGLDDDAGADELTELDKRAWFTWENHRGQQKHFHDGWKTLLAAIYTQASAVAKLKPPRSLDPPCLVYHARKPKKQRQYSFGSFDLFGDDYSDSD
ncbi:hypothetical protein JCM10207_001515 [Rhodosporidiobolus poonsookiae]